MCLTSTPPTPFWHVLWLSPAGDVVMLFGKVDKDTFSLDFKPPLSPAVAMGIALSTFAGKLAVA